MSSEEVAVNVGHKDLAEFGNFIVLIVDDIEIY
jgi:hypothetical protein